MKIFISWSGELSRELGEVLRTWLPSVLQMVNPYFTPSDIEKGARWSSHIAEELQKSQIGIFCLTRENLSSPWVLFEAGAISKVVGDAYVCPILFNLENSDVSGPLAQFQLTSFNKEEMRKLIATINNQCGEQKLLEKTRESVFEMWWPQLETQINEIVSKHATKTKEKIRTDRDLLEEILSLSRLLAKERHENFEKESEETIRNYWKSAMSTIPMGNVLWPFLEMQHDKKQKDKYLKVLEELKKKHNEEDNKTDENEMTDESND